MSTTSKSPRKVARVALAVGCESLPTYAHRFSPRTYTQPQLFACLVLKTFFKTDYRGLVALLEDMPALRKVIGLRRVPHFTTLQKAARRLLLAGPARRLLDATVEKALGGSTHVPLAAVDSSGLESRHVSSYFVRRRSRQPGLWQTTTYIRFPKLAVVSDCQRHVILSTLLTRGPTPDVHQLQRTLRPALARVRIDTLTADAGYDSEANHVFAREGCGIETIIPPKHGRPTPNLPTGYYRRLMATDFDHVRYGQRWQVETVNSMLKRLLGSALRARTFWNQQREMFLMVLTLNIMLLAALILKLFYGAFLTPLIL